MQAVVNNSQCFNSNVINFSFIKEIKSTSFTIPLYITRVQAGLPSPAEDYYENNINLSTYLIKDSAVSFMVGAVGDYMFSEGISQGDMLIVDRTRKPFPGNLVIAVIQGNLTLKRLEMKNGKLYFKSEYKKLPAIEINDMFGNYIWGIVTNIIRDL